MPVSWFTTGSGGSGVGFGALRAAIALAAGANNNLNPGAGWPTGYGRLILTAGGVAAANVTGLLAGVDGQPCVVFNNDPTTVITLNSLNAGSLAANRFLESTAGPAGDLVLPPGFGGILIYDGPLAKWIIT